MTPTAHSASNGAAETTMKVIRRHANLWIQQVEKGCGLGEVIGCHHPLYQRVLLHSCWLHNRFVVRQSHTAYELCANMPYTARLALFGERVLGFVNLSTKSFPTWTKGICNDVHIIAVPGGPPRCLSQGALDVSQNRGTCKWWAKLRLHRGSLDMLHLEHNSCCQSESLRLPFCRCHLQGHEALMLKL